MQFWCNDAEKDDLPLGLLHQNPIRHRLYRPGAKLVWTSIAFSDHPNHSLS